MKELYIDLETTDLVDPAICEIAILDSDGSTLFNEIIDPESPCSAEATATHGLTEANFSEAKPFKHHAPAIVRIIQNNVLVAYNVEFEEKALNLALERCGYTGKLRVPYATRCAMKQFAGYLKVFDEYRGEYAWPKLPNISGSTSHRALTDVQNLFTLVKTMEKYPNPYFDPVPDWVERARTRLINRVFGV